jgi:hypothetical protein
MWYWIIWGRGSFRNTTGLSLENRLQSVMRCRAVCSAFSGQLHSGVGAFLPLKTYERKQPWFVRNCVRMWFGHVYQSVRPHGTTRLPLDRFLWNLIYEYFSKVCRENSSFFKIYKNNGYFAWRPVLLRMKNYQTKVVEKIKTNILCSITFFRKSCHWWDMWKNTAQSDRPQMTMWRMSIACCVPKPTNIHSEYVILIDFPLQQWFHERPSMLRYTYFASLAFLYIFHSCIVYIQFATLNQENAQLLFFSLGVIIP